MNKIYKVIWSKAKHTYVVASEIAKGHTKGETTGKGLKKLAAAMLVAAALLSPSFAWAADTAKVEPAADQTSSAAVEVYTKEGVNNQISNLSTQIGTNTTNINMNATNINGLTTKVNALETADKNLVKEVTGSDAKLTIKKGDDTFTEVTIDNVNHATSADSATTAELATKATQDGQGNEISATYATKTDAAVQDGAIVKAANTIGDNVTKLDAALAKETADRLGADAAQDKVIQQVNQNMVDGFNTINKNVADGFTALNQADAKEAQERAAADTALQTNINDEKTAREAADKKLVEATNGGLGLSDDNVLQKTTTEISPTGEVTTSKTNANEMILNKGENNQITLNKKGIKVGTNSTVVDKDGVYTGGDTYSEAKAALKSDGSIKGADGKFTVDGTTGNVSTNGTLTAASGTIGNVSMSADGTVTGVKDLTASGKVTADSFTDGTATMSNGNLNGVNQINATGNIVTTGNMQAHDMTATGTITGQEIKGTTGTFGSLSTTGNASVGGTLTTNGITNTGNATTDTLTVKHNATVGGDLGVTGDITGKSLNVGTGDIKGGQITGTGLDVGAGTIKTRGAVETGTLKTTGDATIGGNLSVDKNLTVNGEFNSKTLSSKLDENNYTTINGGKTESKNLKMDAGEMQESTSTFDETGSQAWARDDDSIGKSSMTADKISQSLSDIGDNPKNMASRELSQNTDNKYKITDSVVEGNQSNVENRTANTTDSQISLKDGSDNVLNKSYITQNLKNILQGVQEGTNATTVNQTETGIKSTATDGKNTASTNLSNGGFNTYATDGTNKTYTKQTATDIKNTAEKGTISNSAKDLVNTASENMTNTVGKDLTTTVGRDMKTTVTGKVTEDYKSDLDTKVGGNETHYVKGNQTNTVSGDRTVNVKGTETENFNAQVTNIKTDQTTSVGGNQTNIVAGNQQNTVSGSKTETVKGAVTEKYGSQATTVDGDQRTNVGGNQSNVVAGDQTNTISGSKTETVKGAVTETYGSQTTKVNGDQSTTVTGKQTNSITGDQVNTIGGSQTTTVIGDSSLSAKNITNTATDKITSQIGDGSKVKSEMTADGITNTAEGGTIYNKSKDILNEASGDILNFADGEIGNVATKITNITGDNTVTSDTSGTTFENKAHSTAIKEGTVTKTTISGNTITTGEAVMDYADVMKDLGVRGNATIKGDTTMEGNASVGKDLTVNGKSTLTGDVTMKSNATVEKDLTVKGTTTTDKLVVNNGATITGGTTTDTLHVTSTATFDDIVTMKKDLSVGGNVEASSYTVKGTDIKIDSNGINAGGKVIQNVGKGDISEGSTDAVTGGQLYETNTRVTGLETRMGTVETRVDKLDNKIDKVGANAAAMANLHPMEFDEDSKWNIAAAVGNSGSETASAVGVFYRPNENVMVNASAAMGTGENMFGGGISLRLGQGGNKKKSTDVKAAIAENKELRAKVDELTARMDALLSVLNPNMSKDFPDVPENHWAYEAVSRLAGNGIVEGYEDGKYHGERQMSRYEMAEIIYNALSKGAKAEKKLVEEFRPELQAMAAQKKA